MHLVPIKSLVRASSIRRRLAGGIWYCALFLIAIAPGPRPAAGANPVTFDFDAGSPPLTPGQNLPLDQTAGGITAHFSSPSDTLPGGSYSVQSDASTHFTLSQFAGNYLYPNTIDKAFLDIRFNPPLSGISLAFATTDFQQVETPTTLQLTAYQNTMDSPAVGTASAHGTYASDTMPMGTLTFNSPTPFNLVRLGIPYQPLGASDFLVDNITVVATRAAVRSWTLYD